MKPGRASVSVCSALRREGLKAWASITAKVSCKGGLFWSSSGGFLAGLPPSAGPHVLRVHVRDMRMLKGLEELEQFKTSWSPRPGLYATLTATNFTRRSIAILSFCSASII